MPVRHVVLAVLGAAVLVAGVYLFLEVRATPAAHAGAGTTPTPTQARTTATPEHHEDSAPTPRAPGHDAAPAHPTVATNVAANAPDSPALPGDDEGNERANPTIDAIMDRANKAYDQQDWEAAKAIAGKVLAKQPNNIRMLRIMVSSACIEGDTPVAQKYYEQLPKPDRDQMKVRCDKYGMSLKDPPQ